MVEFPKDNRLWWLWAGVTVVTLAAAHVTRILAREARDSFDFMALRSQDIPLPAPLAVRAGGQLWIVALAVALASAWLVRKKGANTGLVSLARDRRRRHSGRFV